ncbi:MAG: hypothetical protein DBW68_06640 [SAR116 cluster bacterium]|nr:MAG: hypothetical protein DBW68_06640 [SAR116 cluster bacterium]|tara:strand:+ start:529 stop:1047 length:519 start_codon:yes stop_codon:yes gene_type:complete
MLNTLKITFVPLMFLLITGCGLSTTPYATSNHTIYKKVAQQAEPLPVIQATKPVTIKSEVVDVPSAVKKEVDGPIPGTEKIIMRADSILNSEKSCHKIMTLGLAISEGYSQAMTSLKNRSYLVGGNAIAVLKLYEDHDAFAAATSNMNVEVKENHITANNVSGLVANIYQCI